MEFKAEYYQQAFAIIQSATTERGIVFELLFPALVNLIAAQDSAQQECYNDGLEDGEETEAQRHERC